MLSVNEAAGLDFKATAEVKLRVFETMNVASVAVGYGATFVSHVVGKKLHCHLYARGISQRFIILNSFWVDNGQGHYYFSTDLN
jgi:hypothetical protein